MTERFPTGEVAAGSIVVPASATSQRWFVLHTKSRQEKLLASGLAAAGITAYCPMRRQAAYYGRKKVFVNLPLFPSYVFLWGTHDDAYEADRTKRVAKIIQVVDQKRIEWEIQNIRKALSHDAILHPCHYLEEGMLVEVRAGPFKGLQGWVERWKREDKLVLQVESFGRGAYLEIEASLLDPVG
jgi:transcription antitermination factor NusG